MTLSVLSVVSVSIFSEECSNKCGVNCKQWSGRQEHWAVCVKGWWLYVWHHVLESGRGDVGGPGWGTVRTLSLYHTSKQSVSQQSSSRGRHVSQGNLVIRATPGHCKCQPGQTPLVSEKFSQIIENVQVAARRRRGGTGSHMWRTSLLSSSSCFWLVTEQWKVLFFKFSNFCKVFCRG